MAVASSSSMAATTVNIGELLSACIDLAQLAGAEIRAVQKSGKLDVKVRSLVSFDCHVLTFCLSPLCSSLIFLWEEYVWQNCVI
jgi:hypothetical protein